jgi:hypothetical protein
MQVQELPYLDPPLPSNLTADELFALVAYSHDAGTRSTDENLYFQLNKHLRTRDATARQVFLHTWGGYTHYLLKGMSRLSDYEGDGYRGYPDKATVFAQYKVGRPVQWGAFTSVSTSFSASKLFTNQADGVVFKIRISSGKDISPYSFFPSEREILLSPALRFFVSSEPYRREGYWVIDMIEQHGAAWVS